MDGVIQTQRLIIRELALTDAKAFYQLNSDLDVLKYTGDLPFESIDHARDFLKNYTAYKQYGYGRWAVVLKDSNRFIGWCGLKYNEDNLVDLGFRFFKSFWSKGYATESALACLHYGFNDLGIHEIIGRSATDNKASIRVLEKLGMLFWKHHPCKGINDAVYYKITKQQFEEKKND